MRRKGLALLLLVVFAVMIGGCAVSYEEIRMSDKKTVAPESKLIVHTENGNVNIVEATGNDIVVEIEKVVRGDNQLVMEAFLSSIKVIITEEADQIVIDIDRPVYPSGVNSSSVNFTIGIPITEVNDILINTSNALITVEKFTGKLVANTSNASIQVTSVTGDMNLYTYNGKITGKDIAGQIVATTSNAAIDVDTDRKLDIVELSTTNGSIDYEGSVQLYGQYDLITSNGNIDMSVPDDSQITLEAVTTNGQVICDFPIYPETELNPDEVYGVINGGGASVNLHTTNGDIYIHELWF